MRETASERLSRLLALVPWLDRHPGVSMTDAAAHFGVTPEVLERDLWLVVCCGLPGHGPDQLIDIQFWDDDEIINVIDPQTLQRPLRVTPDEAMALLVGLRVLASVPGASDQASVASVTARLEESLGLLGGDAEATVVMSVTDDDAHAAIRAALLERRQLRLRYAGASRDEISVRTVDPLAVQTYAGRDYLAAFCESAGAPRTFRVDRIISAEVGEPIPEREEPQLLAPVAPDEGQVVYLRVYPEARWLLEAMESVAAQPDPDGSTRVELVVADRAWLIRTVVGLAGAVEVLAPADLRDQVRFAAQEALVRQGGAPEIAPPAR